MQEAYPEILEAALAELEKKAECNKRKWDTAIGTEQAVNGGFSFGFGDDSDEEVP